MRPGLTDRLRLEALRLGMSRERRQTHRGHAVDCAGQGLEELTLSAADIAQLRQELQACARGAGHLLRTQDTDESSIRAAISSGLKVLNAAWIELSSVS